MQSYLVSYLPKTALQIICLVSSQQPKRQRFEHNWQYNYTVGFLKCRMLPDDGLWKTETYWGLMMCLYDF